MRSDVYQRVTDTIVADLKKGVRPYAIMQNLKLIADTKTVYLGFNQPLRRLHQALLHFADTDRQSAWDQQTLLGLAHGAFDPQARVLLALPGPWEMSDLSPQSAKANVDQIGTPRLTPCSVCT
jgi:hypothetical protein